MVIVRGSALLVECEYEEKVMWEIGIRKVNSAVIRPSRVSVMASCAEYTEYRVSLPPAPVLSVDFCITEMLLIYI